MAVVPPFPTLRPTGYDWLDDEPVFDPARHLQLEPPGATTSLAELGYSADEIAPTATPVAFSEPFRVLSDEGAEVLLEVARGYAAMRYGQATASRTPCAEAATGRPGCATCAAVRS